MTSGLRKLLADLDARIVQQRRILLELEQNRSNLLLELRNTATFDVLTLPVEIITDIFLWCHQISDSSVIPSDSNRLAPLVLSAVCRAWRDIALTTPDLWAALEIVFDKTIVDQQPRSFYSSIESWLSRAKNFPLSLKLTSHILEASIESSHLRCTLDRWSHHIGSLELFISSCDIRLLRLHLAKWPVLEKAILSHEPGADSNPQPIQLFHDAPLLCAVVLRIDVSMSYTLPWAQLTKYDGVLSDLELFVLAPNLAELRCRFKPNPAVDAFAIKEHHCLRSLTFVFEWDGVHGPIDLLQYLTLPALQFLDISTAVYNTYSSLESFFERSSPPLMSIRLRGDDTCLYRWHGFIPLVARTLAEVEIHRASEQLMEDFLDLSLFGMLSNLQSLTFRYPHQSSAQSPYHLLDFAHACAFPPHELQDLKFIWKSDAFLQQEVYSGRDGSKIVDSTVGHLRRLSETGMNVYFGTESRNYL